MSVPDFLIWHCAGCGAPAEGKKKPCDCVTNVGTRAGPNGGKREQTWWDEPPKGLEIPRDVLDEVVAALNRAIGIATAKEPSLVAGLIETAGRLDDAINDALEVDLPTDGSPWATTGEA